MLDRLLRLVAQSDGLVTTASLAHQLQVDDRLIDPMLELLVDQGYLHAAQTDCRESKCKHCPAGDACSASLSPIRLWTLTEKGLRVVHSPN